MKKLLVLTLVLGILFSCSSTDDGDKVKNINYETINVEDYSDKIRIYKYTVNNMEYRVFVNIDGGGTVVVNTTLEQLKVDELKYDKMHR